MEAKNADYFQKIQNSKFEVELEKAKFRKEIDELKDKLTDKEEELKSAKQAKERPRANRTGVMERSKRGTTRTGHSFITGMKSEISHAPKGGKMEHSQPPEENKENNPNENKEEVATDL